MTPDDDTNIAEPAEPTVDAAPAAPDAPGEPTPEERRKRLSRMAEDLAIAEARKPLEGPFSDVNADTEDKRAARLKLKEAYAAATAATGPLRAKFDAAKKSFNRAVIDMAAVPAAPSGAVSALDAWLKFAFDSSGGRVNTLLNERKDLKTKTATPGGPNEQARADAQAATKAWATRYADWSAPVEKLTAQIGLYADKIDKLNADINNEVNRMAAMTSFWFEVAPRHLQIATDLEAGVKTAVNKVAAKLAGYEDLKDLLTIGSARFATDGSLYLVADADTAARNRETVLENWNTSAIKQAKTEAAFKLAPDDFATNKQRYDKLKDDGWIAEAKKFPETA
ncbi:MAG: hypothetical protein ACK5SX_06070 [Sandaracinobacter sp.]